MIKRFFKTLMASLMEVQERRAAYWQLHHMSDKELKDIGVSRAEIYNKVYGLEAALAKK
jgi:uncharacterized protein YjiS (DUF1127 family)